MCLTEDFPKLINNKIKPAIVRIIVTKPFFNEDGSIDTTKNTFTFGTGFMINHKAIVSCSHLLSLKENFKEDIDLFKKINKKNPEVLELKNFIIKYIRKIEFQRYGESSFSELKLKNLDIDYDCSVFEFGNEHNKKIGLELDPKRSLEEGEEVVFAGYPTVVPQYKLLETPFTVNEGIISSFPEIIVGGLKKYKFIQVNAVNLGGNSGAPLFMKRTGKVIGIIAGNQNIGFDIFQIKNEQLSGKIDGQKVLVTAFGVAYATPISYVIPLISRSFFTCNPKINKK
jgi:hypothetical protein